MLTSGLSKYLLDQIGSAALVPHPWRHAHLESAIPPELAEDLVACFERAPLLRCEQTGADKTYRFSTATLSLDSPLPGGPWREGLRTFSSGAYREALGSLTGVPLGGADVTFDLWEYVEGDWLSPHLDKPEKLVTQVIYLTPGWHEGAGGRLLIQECDEPASAVRRIPPRFGNATILVRSNSSWHAVEPVAPGSPPRRSMTVTFWSEGRPPRPDRSDAYSSDSNGGKR
jgi:Rps23 Pro-64 3,4-dihydroxylase Tpa1-like proline 4-hydroxylase